MLLGQHTEPTGMVVSEPLVSFLVSDLGIHTRLTYDKTIR